MEIKLTPQGLLIYAALGLYLAAFVELALRRKSAGRAFYLAGFGCAAAAFLYRWHHVGHVPLQNMFEVFLCLGMLSFPLSAFYRRVYGVGGETADALVGFVVLFPAGFVFSADPQMLPPALQSWLFIPHVAAYMLAYMILFKGSTLAAQHLWIPPGSDNPRRASLERSTYRVLRLGFPLLTLGLVLGAVWGKLAWGGYWNWDPKELWSLATWLVYLAYFHFRYTNGVKHPRTNSTLALTGSVFVFLTLVWVNLASKIFPGLHAYA